MKIIKWAFLPLLVLSGCAPTEDQLLAEARSAVEEAYGGAVQIEAIFVPATESTLNPVCGALLDRSTGRRTRFIYFARDNKLEVPDSLDHLRSLSPEISGSVDRLAAVRQAKWKINCENDPSGAADELGKLEK